MTDELCHRIEDFKPRAPYGARLALRGDQLHVVHISNHVPRTGHDHLPSASPRPERISNHVPRTGHDACSTPSVMPGGIFQTTCPVRGTTPAGCKLCSSAFHFKPRAPYGARRFTCSSAQSWLCISNHVPRTGHDSHSTPFARQHPHFKPRAPYGARPVLLQPRQRNALISNHVLRTGHDWVPCRGRSPAGNFKPRAPYGARQQKCTNSILHFCNNRQ